MSKKAIPVFLFVTIILLDQLLKVWVKTNMMLGEEFSVVGHWMRIHFSENYGMAFGKSFAGVAGKYVLTVIRVVAVVLLTIYIRRLVFRNAKIGYIIGLTLIMTGAFGNVVDSIFYGELFSTSQGQVASFVPWGTGYSSMLQGNVVDMFYMELLNTHLPTWFPFWPNRHIVFFRPVFNIADIAITSGVL